MISIIIPVYNVEAYIGDSLRSLLNQTYTDYEIILVDDGSSDKSIEIAKRLIEEHGLKKYTVITEENSGQGTARNRGISDARGEWIYFMDSDDIVPSNALSVLLETAEKTFADLVFCGFKYSKKGFVEDEASKYKINIYTSEEIQSAFLLRQKKILVPGTLYKSDWLKNKKLVFPQLRFSEDVYFLWNAIVKADRIAEVDGCLYTYIVRDNSTMTASKVSNVVISYDAFRRLSDNFQEDGSVTGEVKRWMLSRWVFGIMRANAGVMKWETYERFMKELSYIEHCRNLKRFPDLKVRVMRNIILYKLKLFYFIAAKWNPYI